MEKDIKRYDLLAPVAASKSINIVKVEGAEYTDDQGRGYVDLNEMCQVLGQKNETYIKAMTEAVSGITTHKVGFSPAKAKLYEHFVRTTNGEFKGFHLTASGSEAVEWAVRLAKYMTGRSEVISFWNSIHGRTYYSASMSGLPRRKVKHGALAPGVVLVPYPRCAHCPNRGACGGSSFPCLEYAKKQYHFGSAEDAAAVIVEPYQGACIDLPPEGYMKALYDWTKEQGMLFIMDENQAGMGRSGDMYNYQRLGIQPDILLLGKSLGNGMHISALLMRELPDPAALPALAGGVGDETLGCASACQVFEQLEDGLLDHVKAMGKVLAAGLEPLAEYESVLDVRCIGLAAAVEFKRGEDCAKVCKRLAEEGFFVGRVEDCVTLKPPYVITQEQLRRFTAALKDIIAALA